MLSLVHFLTPPRAVWVFTNILMAQEGWAELFRSSRSSEVFPFSRSGWILNESGQDEWALLGEENENRATAETTILPSSPVQGASVKAIEVYF